MLLTHSITHNGQILEISVYYTPLTNTVTEIKSIWLHSMGAKLPVTDIIMHMFEPEINRIVSQVDWREIYRAVMECDYTGEHSGINLDNMNPVFAKALRPFVK